VNAPEPSPDGPPDARPTSRFAPNFLLELFSNPLDPGYADAAARKARYGPRPPWRRRGAFSLRVLTLVAVGFLFAVSYREVVATAPDRNSAHAGLVEEIKAAQSRTDGLQQRSDELRREVTVQQQAALGGSAEQLRQVREQEARAGLAAVTGPGAVVRMVDAPTPIDPTTGKPSTTEVNRVLDVDVQAAVNGLWASGAEAIAVNGQRLTSTSTIRTAGSAILVDFRPVTSPYEISAIGPGGLETTFNRSGSATALRDLADRYGLTLSTRSENNLNLPPAPNPTLRYAQSDATPAPSGPPSGSPTAGPTGASPTAPTPTGGR
jgi:uncharacterized protein YlxW (UPF0749 family)